MPQPEATSLQIFLVFLLAYALSQFFRSFLAVIAPELSAELNLTPADLGLMSATWFAAFAVAQFPVGWALDRFGPRRTVALGMLAAVVGALVCARAQGLSDGIVAMALIGIGCAPIYMGALYIFGRVFAADRFALLASWMLAFGSGGNLLATTPLALVADRVGWRTAFIGIAAITALSSALVALLIKDPPRVAKPIAGRSGMAEFHDLLRIRALWPLLPLIAVSYAVVIAERGVWVGPYLAEVYGLAAVPRGNAVFLIAAATIIGTFAIGALDRHVARKTLVAVGSGVACALFVVLWIWPTLPLGMAVSAVGLIGAFGTTYAVLMAHGRTFLPDHLLGRGITLMNFTFMTGTALVQLISGRVVETLKAAGHASSDVFATLHLGFGIALLLATLVYLTAREAR
jgi:predicted MFS family arabinose efflux permease